jgi:hypothetical protein
LKFFGSSLTFQDTQKKIHFCAGAKLENTLFRYALHITYPAILSFIDTHGLQALISAVAGPFANSILTAWNYYDSQGRFPETDSTLDVTVATHFNGRVEELYDWLFNNHRSATERIAEAATGTLTTAILDYFFPPGKVKPSWAEYWQRELLGEHPEREEDDESDNSRPPPRGGSTTDFRLGQINLQSLYRGLSATFGKSRKATPKGIRKAVSAVKRSLPNLKRKLSEISTEEESQKRRNTCSEEKGCCKIQIFCCNCKETNC